MNLIELDADLRADQCEVTVVIYIRETFEDGRHATATTRKLTIPEFVAMVERLVGVEVPR